LQKRKGEEKLKITIDNYKNACQRQIIFEPNGKIKEYHKNTNILIFVMIQKKNVFLQNFFFEKQH